jgi:hypothetical protein
VIGEPPADLQEQIPYSAGIASKAKDARTQRAGLEKKPSPLNAILIFDVELLDVKG